MTRAVTDLRTVDQVRLARLLGRERARYTELHSRSRESFAEARGSLLAGVPMSWMSMWAGGYPLYFTEARGNRITDVDGHTYVDFCLGDTGAMTGHSPAPVLRAIRERLEEKGGVTTMLPTADAAAVGADLARRFGLPLWQFSLTATDANRFILRMCRQISKRPWVLVFSHCYHGTVDETVIVVGADGRPRSKQGNVGPAVDPVQTTKVVEFNDVEALREALAPCDVACVLMEPALTNIGIVLPEPGYLDRGAPPLRRDGHAADQRRDPHLQRRPGWLHPGLGPSARRRHHRQGAGVGSAHRRLRGDGRGRRSHPGRPGRRPDRPGWSRRDPGRQRALDGGRPGHARRGADRRCPSPTWSNWPPRIRAGVDRVLESRRVPWCIVQLGARAEYRFCPEPPRTGGESAAAHDAGLDEYLHLYTVNRGILMTPFHNMALMCPETTPADVDLHTEVFAQAVDELFG